MHKRGGRELLSGSRRDIYWLDASVHVSDPEAEQGQAFMHRQALALGCFRWPSPPWSFLNGGIAVGSRCLTFSLFLFRTILYPFPWLFLSIYHTYVGVCVLHTLDILLRPKYSHVAGKYFWKKLQTFVFLSVSPLIDQLQVLQWRSEMIH